MATRADVMRLDIRVDNAQALAALKQFESQTGQTAQKVERNAGGMTSSFGGLRAAITPVTAAIGAFVAAVIATDRVLDFADRVSGVTVGFQSLTSRAGESADVMLSKLRPATQGLITDFELMQQANTALLLGIPATSDELAELTKAAVLMGQALGKDAPTSIESMITGLGRQSKLMLDNLGIIIDVEAAYREYAMTLGVTVEQLTDTDRQQAFLNATLAQSRAAVATLSGELDTLGMAWDRMKVFGLNAINLVTDALNRGVIPAMKNWQKTIQDALAMMRMIGDPGLALIGTLSIAAGTNTAGPQSFGPLKPMIPVAPPDRGPVPEPRDPFEAESRSDIDLGPMLLAQAMEPAFSDMDRYTLLVETHRAEQTALVDVLLAARDGYVGLDGALASILSTQYELADSGVQWTDTLQAQAEATLELAAAAEISTAKYDVMASAMTSAAGALFEFASGSEISARAVVNSIARQTFGILSALAIESVIRGMQQTALALAAAARYDYVSAGLHAASAKTFYATAAKAGIGAGVALGIGALSGGGGGGGGRGGGGSSDFGGVFTPEATGPSPTTIHIFIDGQGFIQDMDAFVRGLSTGLQQQLDRAGVTIGAGA